jgi:hypothetical protein
MVFVNMRLGVKAMPPAKKLENVFAWFALLSVHDKPQL